MVPKDPGARHQDISRGAVGAPPHVAGVVRRTRVPATMNIAKVVPDVAGIARVFDYQVPTKWEGSVRVGTMVRVVLNGRRVGGWVVSLPAQADTDKPLSPLAKVTGFGPPAEVVELAQWAAWRWAGRLSALLRSASPSMAVGSLPRPGVRSQPSLRGIRFEVDEVACDALLRPRSVVRLPPGGDVEAVVVAAAAVGDALVVTPSIVAAAYLAARLRHLGYPVALLPREWARSAAGGCITLGARAAVWAPCPTRGPIVVIDEHDEALQEERAPTWHARDVALERARRAGVACVLTSPCPSLEALKSCELVTVSRTAERAGWPIVEVVDRREEAPGAGLYSSQLVAAIRAVAVDERVVCVLNRKGRARLLVCSACGTLARCSRCQAAMEQATGLKGSSGTEPPTVWCRRCDQYQAAMCASCGRLKLKYLRPGVSRAAEELQLLVGRPVAEVTAATSGLPGNGPLTVLVGTEAVLHRVTRAALVAFLDFDAELLAPRYRASEVALGLLARAGRILDGRSRRGRLMVQTRVADHEVLEAVQRADPSRVAVVEMARRVMLGFPPESALALISGAAAPAFIANVARWVAEADNSQQSVETLGPTDDGWLVRASDHGTLSAVLNGTARPPGRLRIEVDPLRV